MTEPISVMERVIGDMMIAREWGKDERRMLYGDTEMVPVLSQQATFIRLRHIMHGDFNRDTNELRVHKMRQDLEIGDAVVIGGNEHFTVIQWAELADQPAIVLIQLRSTIER